MAGRIRTGNNLFSLKSSHFIIFIQTAIPYVNNVAKTLLEYIEGGPESDLKEFEVKDVSFLNRCVDSLRFN